MASSAISTPTIRNRIVALGWCLPAPNSSRCRPGTALHEFLTAQKPFLRQLIKPLSARYRKHLMARSGILSPTTIQECNSVCVQAKCGRDGLPLWCLAAQENFVRSQSSARSGEGGSMGSNTSPRRFHQNFSCQHQCIDQPPATSTIRVLIKINSIIQIFVCLPPNFRPRHGGEKIIRGEIKHHQPSGSPCCSHSHHQDISRISPLKDSSLESVRAPNSSLGFARKPP